MSRDNISSGLSHLVDIVSLPAESNAQQHPVTMALPLILALLLCLFLLMLLRRYRRPLRQLHRELRAQRIDARTAAHRLAALGPFPPSIETQLQAYRFARQPPRAQQMLELIAELGSQRP